MAVKGRKEALRRDGSLPQVSAGALALLELGFVHGLVERENPIADLVDLRLVDPDAVLAPVDVEGAEGLVLAGMRRVLREQRPVVAIEFHDDAGWAGRRELLDAGYQLAATDGSAVDPEGPRVYHVIARPSASATVAASSSSSSA